MKPNEKMALFQKINIEKVTDAETFYETLEKCDALKTNYGKAHKLPKSN